MSAHIGVDGCVADGIIHNFQNGRRFALLPSERTSREIYSATLSKFCQLSFPTSLLDLREFSGAVQYEYMSSATLELYNALIAAGVSQHQAEQAAKAVISREEAREILVTKAELYKALIIQAGFIVTVLGLIVAITQ